METKMKTTLLLWSFLLFLVGHADPSGKDSDLKCSQRTEAELGKDVTLDCYCEPRCDVTQEELKWKFNQKTFVLAYIGTYNIGYQDAQFSGRAHVTSTERLKDGNFPLTISKVRSPDEGTYTCHVGSKTCSVELKDQGFKLECPEETVEVQVGKNVTLNCKSETQRDLTEELISWKFNSTIFFDFIDGQKHLHKHFKDRVHPVSSWNVSEGKLSVEIDSINETDAGVYTCSVVYVSNCNVTLIVKKGTEEDKKTPGAQGDNTTPTSDGSNNCTGTGIGAFFGGLVLGAVIALVMWLIYRNCRERGGEHNARYMRGRTEPSPNAGE